MNHVRENTESGGRLNIYRNIKIDSATESYLANEWSVGVRRVLAGLHQLVTFCHLLSFLLSLYFLFL